MGSFAIWEWLVPFGQLWRDIHNFKSRGSFPMVFNCKNIVTDCSSCTSCIVSVSLEM